MLAKNPHENVKKNNVNPPVKNHNKHQKNLRIRLRKTVNTPGKNCEYARENARKKSCEYTGQKPQTQK